MLRLQQGLLPAGVLPHALEFDDSSISPALVWMLLSLRGLLSQFSGFNSFSEGNMTECHQRLLSTQGPLLKITMNAAVVSLDEIWRLLGSSISWQHPTVRSACSRLVCWSHALQDL